MKLVNSIRCSPVFLSLLVLAVLGVPPTVQAQQTWNATVGAESKDMGRQVVAFLPNEIWIHAGDSITWTFASDDIHTVTFLLASQPLPPFTVGCPGFSPSGATFDGSTCVTAPPSTNGQSFTVTFPTAGNYKLVCLVHTHMSGVIHVLDAIAILPHDQAFYDEEARDQRFALLADDDDDMENGNHNMMGKMFSLRVLSDRNSVTAGVGEMTATPGGFQSLSVVRFLDGEFRLHTGDTVEWSNSDPAMPHTITFGAEPVNPVPPSPNVFVDPDGALHAILKSPSDSAHSGLIVAAPQNQLFVPQSPPGVTRFRITFKQAGTYFYKCVLHDNLGMVGKLIVQP
jgi:plastocyanin